MSKNFYSHTVHIPVMGIGYTIDTPIRVAHLGLSSVMPMGDDTLLEILREHYCKLHNFPFEPITDDIYDCRAKRITAYLNLVNIIVKNNFNNLIESDYYEGSDLEKYFSLLPDYSILKKNFIKFIDSKPAKTELHKWLKENLVMGCVDVNIMTKLDKENYKGDELLPPEFNNAHAALRGFANSDLNSSVILSAGFNPRLYSYIENFKDFYPDVNGNIKKRIILKISDYRSAIIQGKVLAKKGLWISEYRVESGLNCGGHAFATDGYLLGPILEELKTNKKALSETLHSLMVQALKDKNMPYPETAREIKITVQGGVGTAEEHQFLLDQYDIDSVGWGTPFLLVPEVTNVDDITRELLRKAEEKDIYLSEISPLGVPFNSLRGNTQELKKQALIDKGKPGSSCPKNFLSFNKEFTDLQICIASRQYQKLKIEELESQNLEGSDFQIRYNKIVDKDCICVGLTNTALLVNGLEMKKFGDGVSVCPGPNLAYFSEIVSLKKMIDHIYGRINLMLRKDRPHFFIKELGLYIDYFRNLTDSFSIDSTDIQKKQLLKFRDNLVEGINYYKELFSNLKTNFADMRETILNELQQFEEMAIEALEMS